VERKLTEALKVISKDAEVMSPASRVPYFPLVIRRGKGATIEDIDGNCYIDFLSSAAVLSTGHAPPRVVAAIKKQADDFIHYTPAYMYHKNMVELAQELCQITPGNNPKKVSFGLSGSDANDGAIKLARRFTKRQKIIAFLRSYHGTTYGAMSLSAISLNMRRNLGPFLPEIYHVPFADCYRCPFKLEPSSCNLACIDYLKMLFDTTIPAEEVAAIIVEPIQGDAGIVVPPDEYLPALKKICEEHGILFIAEEVQTGFGRTGKWFAIDHWNIEPDVIIMGKAIASGMPLSALVARKEIMDSWNAPAHLFTMEGNPVCCAAALATIETIREEDLVEKSREMGDYIKGRFNELKKEHELIGDVRGRGLLIGVDLVTERESKQRAEKAAAKICWRCWEKGLILTFFSKSVLRVAPPLVITRTEAEHALDIIEDSFKELEAGKIPDEVLDNIRGW
jgi:4-aminobutyrate aminotransferase